MKLFDMREITLRQRHALIIEAFGTLQLGEAFALVKDHEPTPIYYQFDAERAGQFAWLYLKQDLRTLQAWISRSIPAR